MILCPLASLEKPTDPHLWSIVSIDEKHYNHWWYGKRIMLLAISTSI
jgi:hypothetical protein